MWSNSSGPWTSTPGRQANPCCRTLATSGPGEKTWPAWSPDGSRILFTHTQEGRSGLSLVRIDSGEIRPYTPFGPDSGIQLKDRDWRATAD